VSTAEAGDTVFVSLAGRAHQVNVALSHPKCGWTYPSPELTFGPLKPMPRLPGLPHGVTALRAEQKPLLVPKSGRISVAPFPASLPKRDPSRAVPPDRCPTAASRCESSPTQTGGLWVRLNTLGRRASVQVWFLEQPCVISNSCSQSSGASSSQLAEAS
jgi:hypothetical protein